MKKNLIIILILSSMCIASNGFAQDRVDKRQRAQRVRIADGRKDGEVTKRESSS